MDEKNYDEWNRLKQQLNISEHIKHVREGDIWFCSIGINIGHEQNGKNQYFERPVLITRKFTRDCFLAIPLTSVDRVGPLSIKFKFDGKDRVGLLFQMRSYDSKRLQRKLGSVSTETFCAITQAMYKLLLNQKIPLPGSKDVTASSDEEASEAYQHGVDYQG